MASIERTEAPRLIRVDNAEEAAIKLADEIELRLCHLDTLEHGYVLGLPTGRSPLALYLELIRRHRTVQLSFKGLTSFNLDEYVGTDDDDLVSFSRWMDERFFSQLDIPDEAVHFPTVADTPNLFTQAAQAYEKRIQQAGGIDLLVLGVGENGHIAFNEPGSSPTSRTRVVDLIESTRQANQDYFGPGVLIPQRAMTMGIATILQAKRIRVLAFGAKKQAAVYHLLEGCVDIDWPCSHLRNHPDVMVFADAEAASGLSPKSLSR
jgi:glucosamine-6-phosphate deaminase